MSGRTLVSIPLLIVLLLISVSTFAQSVDVALCGTVQNYTSAKLLSSGLLMIDGNALVLAARSQITGETLLQPDAKVCVTGSLNAEGQLTNAEVRANATTRVSICGNVTSFAEASANAAGAIAINGNSYTIAAGTTIANRDLLTAGANVCVDLTVNALGEVVAPSSVSANVGADVDICAEVNAFSAASTLAPGSLTIGGQTFLIAANAAVANETLLKAGARVRLRAHVDSTGAITNATVEASNCGGAGNPPPGGGNPPPTGGGGNPPPKPNCENQPPMLSVPDVILRSDVASQFRVETFDSENELVTVDIVDGPEGSRIDAGTVTVPPAGCSTGNADTMTLVARDQAGNSTVASIPLIERANVSGQSNVAAPILSLPQTLLVAIAGANTVIPIAAASLAGCDVNISTSDDVVRVGAGLYAFNPSVSAEGTVQLLRFTATDCNGVASSSLVRVAVGGANAEARLFTPMIRIDIDDDAAATGFSVPIENHGNASLIVKSIGLSAGSGFSIDRALRSAVVLKPGARLNIPLHFDGRAGAGAGVLEIATNDAMHATTRIQLSAH